MISLSSSNVTSLSRMLYHETTLAIKLVIKLAFPCATFPSTREVQSQLVRMSWILTLILLTSTFLSEAKHHLPSAATTVVGAVYCDTCTHQEPPKPDPFIAGATVAVECKGSSSRPPFRQEVTTNGQGEFRLELPFSIAKRVKTIRGCNVALVRSNEPSCATAAAATSSTLRLKSRDGKEQIFSAGLFSFKPQICNQVQTAGGGSGSPEKFFLPPNPLNPGLLPPNPLLPPPSLIPPVLPTPPPSIIPPVLPTPPPSLIPPILPTPPSSTPSFPLPLPLPPLIPGLVPSPSPPPPVLPVPLPPLPVPLPPLPVPPVPFLPPGIPGGPPAEVSSKP